MKFDTLTRSLRFLGGSLYGRAAPLFLLLALLAGGGGRSYPLITAFIALAGLCLLAIELARFRWAGRPISFKFGCALALVWVLFILCQIMPLPPGIWHDLPGRAIPLAFYEIMGWHDAWHPLSLTPGLTWAALLACVAPIAMFLSAAATSREEAIRLIRLALLVAIGSAILGVIQFGAGAASPIYLFDTAHRGVGVGLFINRNHQATFLLVALVLAAIPGVVLPDRMRKGADGTRAGLLLLLLATLLAGAILATTSRTGITLLPIAILGAAAVAYLGGATTGHWSKLLIGLAVVGVGLLPTPVVQHTLARFATVAEDQRQDYWSNTLLAIDHSFPAGTGLGSFRTIYPTVEPLEQVGLLRVNNAHNDYLELALEAGLPGLVILGLVLALILFSVIAGMRKAQTSWRRAFSLAAGFAFLLMIAGSVVDYPLRMTSIAVLAALLLGLLVRNNSSQQQAKDRNAGPVARTLIFAFASLLGWQIIATQWARHQLLAGDGAGATASAPWLAQGWSLRADKAAGRGRPAAGIEPARTALAIAPLDAVALRALGLGLIETGDTVRGNALLEAGAVLGWREAVNQYWLVDRALAFGAYDVAVQRLDALLRLNRASNHQLDRLVAIAQAPGGRAAIVAALSDRPGWRQAFFNAMARQAQLPTIMAVLRGVNATTAPIAPTETALIRWKLADRAEWAAVRAVWMQSHGAHLLGDGAFSLGSEDLSAAGPPLAWRAPALPGAHALIAEPDLPWRQEAVMVTSSGMTRGTVLAQGLVLEPGQYRLRLMQQGGSTTIPSTQWVIACNPGGADATITPIALRWHSARDDWKQGQGAFAINAGCPAQDLRLELETDDGQSGSLFIDDVAIERLGPVQP